MPPDTLTPGQRSLISPVASMNAFANAACSSMPGADGEDVGVEDDVLRREAGALGEQRVGPRANLDLAIDGLGLALLVERHHERGGPEAAHAARLIEERLLALLEAERVGDALPLNALEPRLEDGEARAVDHDRQHGHFRLGRYEVEEPRHRGLGVEEVRVHVHVDEVGSAAHLVERDVEGSLVVVRLDEAAEARRPGDVRSLADEHEARVRADHERLEAAERGQGASAPGSSEARGRRWRRRSPARGPGSSRSSLRRR